MHYFIRLLLTLAFISAVATTTALAQAQGAAPTDSATPPGVAKGTHPLGSYGGSSFDRVNLFNGNVGMTFRLGGSDGRAGLGAGVVLSYNSKFWQLYVERPNQSPAEVIPDYDEWDGGTYIGPGWRIHPGRLYARRTGFDPTSPGPCAVNRKTLTRLTFVSPDGSEFELRDTIRNGEPYDSVSPGCPAGQVFNRGNVFTTADGTSATFVLDAGAGNAVWDDNTVYEAGDQPVTFHSGWMYLRDGSKFRIEAGRVTEQRDRNGNIVRYTYSGGLLTTITDTLGRTITLEYDVQDTDGTNLLARITENRGAAADRVTKIVQGRVKNFIRDDYPQGDITFGELWTGCVPGTTPFNPKIPARIILPTGHEWKFEYNRFGEVARVLTPAGGAVEYDIVDGAGNVDSGTNAFAYRTVSTRRTYVNAANNNEEGRTDYGDASAGYTSVPPIPTEVTVSETRFAGTGAGATKISRTQHTFHEHPMRSIRDGRQDGYSRWREGKEFRTIVQGWAGSNWVTRTVVNQTWEQRAAFTDIWDMVVPSDPNDPTMPSNDPRLMVTKTTLSDTNKVSEVRRIYDNGLTNGFNNVTQETVSDWGTGVPGAVLRKTDSTYETSAIYTSATASPIVHMRSLVKSVTVGTSTRTDSRTDYAYDTQPLEFVTFSGPTHDFVYQGSTRPNRGNVTEVKVDDGTAADPVTRMKYDMFGNVVETVNPLGQVVEVTMDSATDYAYPLSSSQTVTGADGVLRTLSVTTDYDRDTGLLETSTGVNAGETTDFDYDLIGRVTSIDRPGSAGVNSYSYSSSSEAGLWVREVTQIEGSTSVETKSYFDGLFRPYLVESTDPQGSGIVKSKTEYDGLGRVDRVSNPYRGSSPDAWTKSVYDDRDRVLEVQSWNASMTVTSGKVVTAYSGNEVTVTDQSGKVRKSTMDGAGRLVTVVEDPTVGGLNYTTSYLYDSRDNLAKVTQGSQPARFFMYDAAGRLIRVRQPEQTTLGSLALTDPVSGNASWTMGYTYDKASNMLVATDARGITTTYTYDQMQRVRTKNYSGTSIVDVEYVYDDSALPSGIAAPPAGTFTRANTNGRLFAAFTRASSGSEPLAELTASFYSYDVAGRTTQYSQLLDGVYFQTTSTFNAAGSPLTETYRRGTTQVSSIANTYNASGMLETVARSGSTLSTVAPTGGYTPAGALAKQTLDNGLVHTIDYNLRLQPTTIGLGTTASNFDRFKLEYKYGVQPGNWSGGDMIDETKNNGNLSRVTITPGSGQNPIEQDFAYDGVNRLTDAREYGTSASGTGTDTIGVYDPATGYFYLRNSNSSGSADIVPFSFGPGGLNWKPIDGDWDGNGTDTIGVYDPVSSTFYLRNTNSGGNADVTVQFGAAGTAYTPISGDWDGNGTDTIGLYYPPTGAFFLRNNNAGGADVPAFTFGPGGSDWKPVSGDWDNDGDDAVGIYSNNAGQIWYLRNDNTAGVADISIGFGQPGSMPITGDWNNDGTDTIGIYHPNPGNFFLRNENSPGNSHHVFQFGPGSGIGISGDWDGLPGSSGTGSRIVWRQEFSYDQWGNRSWGFGTTSNASGPAVVINTATNRLTSSGGQTCVYDAAGNVTGEGTKTFQFNAAGMMWKSVTGMTSTYVYDAHGRRVKKTDGTTVTRFIYNAAGALVAEYAGSSPPATPTKEYVYGASGLLATVDSGGTKFLTPDHLGSTRIVTDSANAVSSRHDYFPFGEEIGSLSRTATGYGQTGPRQKFTSYERDGETGLDFAQARYFSSAIGRFASPDPFVTGDLVALPQLWNRFAYTMNRPLVFVDPSGELPQKRGTPAGPDFGDDIPTTGGAFQQIDGDVFIDAIVSSSPHPEFAGGSWAGYVYGGADAVSDIPGVNFGVSRGLRYLFRFNERKADEASSTYNSGYFGVSAATFLFPGGLKAPAGGKLQQMIGRWISRGGGTVGRTGGNVAFMEHATNLVTTAQRTGTIVESSYLGGAYIARSGNTYIVLADDGRIVSYVAEASPGWGVAAHYVAAGGK
ncbi:MAG: RHS repeat-associated core domain-containing protein [Blastocatellia bacterium]